MHNQQKAKLISDHRETHFLNLIYWTWVTNEQHTRKNHTNENKNKKLIPKNVDRKKNRK